MYRAPRKRAFWPVGGAAPEYRVRPRRRRHLVSALEIEQTLAEK